MFRFLAFLGLTRLPFWIGGGLGFAGGLGAMLIAFPFLFPPPVLDEPPVPADEVLSDASSSFTFDPDPPGRDFVHWADGTGALLRTNAGWVLRLNADFRAGPGPNYWIYFNTGPVGEEEAFLADAKRVKLAALKSFKGGQNYSIPASIDPTKFHTVTIWCESFGVYIGSAVLRR